MAKQVEIVRHVRYFKRTYKLEQEGLRQIKLGIVTTTSADSVTFEFRRRIAVYAYITDSVCRLGFPDAINDEVFAYTTTGAPSSVDINVNQWAYPDTTISFNVPVLTRTVFLTKQTAGAATAVLFYL